MKDPSLLISSLPQSQQDAKRNDPKRPGPKAGVASGFFAPRAKNQENSKAESLPGGGGGHESPVLHRQPEKYKNGNGSSISLKPNGKGPGPGPVPRYEPVRRAAPESNPISIKAPQPKKARPQDIPKKRKLILLVILPKILADNNK